MKKKKERERIVITEGENVGGGPIQNFTVLVTCSNVYEHA
jgi:hypothetical protein